MGVLSDPLQRLDGEDRLEVRRRQEDEAEIDLIHIVLADHIGNRLGALHIGLLLEHAHGGVDRDAALQNRILRGEAHDLALLQGIEHRLVLIGRHDQVSLRPAWATAPTAASAAGAQPQMTFMSG